jgi:hypothetical protein
LILCSCLPVIGGFLSCQGNIREDNVKRIPSSIWAVVVLVGLSAHLTRGQQPAVTFSREGAQLRILIGGQPFARYVWQDSKISRPYFCDLHIPGGPQLTRNHPPVEGKDLSDHATYHPGLWLAFGDINGNDYWRLRSPVRQASFAEEPRGGAGTGSFAVHNVYLSRDGKTVICKETCRITIRVLSAGPLLLWESRFQGGASPVVFGDQEEMGLGFRVATPLCVKRGGRILDSKGHRNEAGVWGKQAAWCDYSGPLGKRWVGITLMPDPGNFRPCWFHARDYGLLLANPFGRNAFTRGEKSRVPIPRGKTLVLRFGVLFHSSRKESDVDLQGVYEDYRKHLTASTK